MGHFLFFEGGVRSGGRRIGNYESQEAKLHGVTLGRSNSKFKLIVGAARKIEGCRDLKWTYKIPVEELSRDKN